MRTRFWIGIGLEGKPGSPTHTGTQLLYAPHVRWPMPTDRETRARGFAKGVCVRAVAAV